jgi:hypothetical protein
LENRNFNHTSRARTRSARREAIIQDADKTEDKDSDLVRGDGGTLGLGDGGDLNKDD